jgi:hypothetical protein
MIYRLTGNPPVALHAHSRFALTMHSFLVE